VADITEHGGNMREIKFRGKSIDTREWVYGYYIKSGPDFHGGERHCIATPGTVADYAGLKFIQVDPKTVGQFIGIPDKNGREIYEGDIRGGYYFCMEDKVEFLEVIKSHLSPYIGYCYYWESIRGCGMPDFMETEIIGNIHENPELLS
jgi:uncharacterized phage protein (TIGR01671 family)